MALSLYHTHTQSKHTEHIIRKQESRGITKVGNVYVQAVADPGFLEGGFRYTFAREFLEATPTFGRNHAHFARS